jgi:hypothetical protein
VIVHVARQPLDQLWSCLRHAFDDAGPSGDARAAASRAAAAEVGDDWSNSLGDAARAFLAYERVMDHFLGTREAPGPADEETGEQAVLPLDAADGEARALAPPSPRGADRALPARARTLDVLYEELVSEPTRVARRLLEHARLPRAARKATSTFWRRVLPPARLRAAPPADEAAAPPRPHTRGIGRAAAYAAQLAPLRDARGASAAPRRRARDLAKAATRARARAARERLEAALEAGKRERLAIAIDDAKWFGVEQGFVRHAERRAVELQMTAVSDDAVSAIRRRSSTAPAGARRGQ